MSATLVARDLGAGHGARTLFAGLDLVVAPGDVVGLVGANGAGKSTLLRLLAGRAAPEQGSLTLSPADAAVGYLPQEPDRRPGESLAAFLARRTGVAEAETALECASSALAEGAAGADDAYASALERWLALGGADLEERADGVRARLSLPAPGADMTGLSGGQAARAGLAALLLSRYDLYLLDEPTNDLDLAGLELLEEVVRGLPAGVVLVSHDREFLARTVSRVVELDLAQQQVAVFGGGYEAYRRERAVARQAARDAYEEYADTRAGLQARARTQRAWMDKGVRNARRKATDPDKNVKAFRAESSEKQAAKARQTDRLIERMEVVEEPRKEWRLQLEIAAAPRSGAVVARLDSAVVARGDFTLGPVTLQVDRADRVAITGANGAGKSTLLAAILGRVPLAAGSGGIGPGVVVGEIDQSRSRLAGSGSAGTLVEAFGAELPDWPVAELRTLLAKFGLGREHVLRPSSGLSPGERTRAGLALLQARGVNLLVLDEPTNHLDLPAIEQLEQALATYPGTLLLVSHDRRLLDAVAVTRRFEVTAEDGHGAVREV